MSDETKEVRTLRSLDRWITKRMKQIRDFNEPQDAWAGACQYGMNEARQQVRGKLRAARERSTP